MIDSFGRNIDYIRISVTDRCNLRCVYCMPEQGVESIPHDKILTFDQIVRLCKILAKNGLKKIKITGGEPLVRKDVVSLIATLKKIEGIKSVTITTNGVLLYEYYESLVKANIDCITVSLDTLQREVYTKLTRRDELSKVLRGLTKAYDANKIHMKINCVPVKGVNDDDIISVLNMAKENSVDIRFIEMMPIGMGNSYDYISENEIKDVIFQNFGGLVPYEQSRGNGPSQYYSIENFKGKIGFISAVSHKFCDSCNRVRLTADGFLKTCLQYDFGVSLKDILTTNYTDEQVLQTVLQAVKQKPKSHSFDRAEEFTDKEHRNMSEIGG